MENEWIPLSEKKPKQGQDIIFVVNNESTPFIGTWIDDGQVVLGNPPGCYDEYVHKSRITHWMPFPTIPTT